MALQALGTCAYNGHTFSPNHELVELRAVPQPDSANRTVVYTVFAITVRDKFGASPGQTLDATVSTAFQQLTAWGGALTLVNKGFGDLSINTGAKKDVLWGPKTKMVDYKILGRDRACQLIWTCEVAIPTNCVSPTYAFKIMEALFTVSYQIDFSGYTTRTISGFLRIPLTLAAAGSGVLLDNADNYRSQIVPVAPLGFRRASSNFTIDESKTKLSYSITDAEMPPNAPPPGVIECSASHSVQSQKLGINTSQWTGTISAGYEIAKDQPKSLAFQYFIQLVTSRILAAAQNATLGGTVLITYLSLSDSDIYGRKAANCTCSYIFTTTLDSILAASGLWTPVPNSDYSSWRASLANGIFSANGRSYAGLQFQNSDDMIISLCSGNVSTLTAGGNLTQNTLVAGAGPANAYPTPAGSYLDYQLNVRVLTDDNVAELKALPNNPFAPGGGGINAPLDQPGPNVNNDGGAQIVSDTSSFTPNYGAGQALTQPQQRAAPSITILLEGRAIRAGYPINPPVLTQVGGVTPIAANKDDENFFVQGQIANWFGVPIFAATWSQRWILPNVPNGPIGVAPSPFTS